METLGDKIKQLRNELTQEDLASLLQVDRSTLASWEVNRREPDIVTLCRIANLFNVSVDWLVGHKSDKCSPSKTSLIHETPNEYHANDAKAWQKVIETAQHYGFDPNTVCQMLELNAKMALSFKKDCK